MTTGFVDQNFIQLWLEQEDIEPRLGPLCQWLDQYLKELEKRHKLAQEAQDLTIEPPPPRPKPQWYAFVKEKQQRHTQLDAQHIQCISEREYARGEWTPPLPILSRAHLQLAFECVEAFQAFALASPLVRDVVDSLQRLIQARSCDPYLDKKEQRSLTMREQARALLNGLFNLLIPRLEPLTFEEQTLNGHVLRANMLEIYKYEHAHITQIFKENTNYAPRLVALREAYPRVPKHLLERWFKDSEHPCQSKHPWQIATELVAWQFDASGTTVRRILSQAKKEHRRDTVLK